MKANKVKSKFVYPDKLYARTNDNITLDISYAPQTMEVVEYVRTDAFVEKACEWLKGNIYQRVYKDGDSLGFPTAVFLEEFKNAMKL